jgi:hypothetical protein
MAESGPGTAKPGERIVLARRTPEGMVKFQWTGAEPPGLDSIDFAEQIGAIWEGNELVTYNMQHLLHNYGHWADEFLEDSD